MKKLKETDNNTYYRQDLLGDKKEDFFKFFVTQNLYDNVDLDDNCKEVLEEICKYYDFYITTDYIWRDVPDYAGKISHEIVVDKALSEFEKYRVTQDKLFGSYFDKFMLDVNNAE